MLGCVPIPMAADRFQSFSATHFVLLVLFALGVWAVIVWGRSHRGTEPRSGTAGSSRWRSCVFAGGMQIYQLTPGDWDIGTSLPLATV